jgi:hypothetical protein
MAIAKITGPGLALIGLAVLLLWGCLIGEKITLRRAHTEYARAMRDVRLLRIRQQRPIPVSLPTPRPPRPARPIAG